MTEEPLVAGLAEGPALLDLLGGKGASLARLVGAGLPVPDGFVVTTRAYELFLTQHGLRSRVEAEIAGLVAGDPGSAEAAAARIEREFRDHPLPREVVDALAARYADLAPAQDGVAVRSSATAEDLAEFSFAGQQDSFLNVRGTSDLLVAVQRCWASLWSARALAYRERQPIPSDQLRMAVVVQRLVCADAAGVLFTSDPVTGDPSTIMINAAWGLGEAVVGGTAAADTVVAAKASGGTIRSTVAAKTTEIVCDRVGTHARPVPPARRTAPVLGDRDVEHLVELGRRIEELYEQPMDIEWARESGRTFIVQARPITSRTDRTELDPWNDSRELDCLWTRGNIGEAIPDVVTPCSRSVLDLVFDDMMPTLALDGYPPVGCVGGRLYFNVSVFRTLVAAVGMGRRRMLEVVEDIFGRIPDDVDIPLLPVSRWTVIRIFVPATVRNRRRIRANVPRLPGYLTTASTRCANAAGRIQASTTATELAWVWRSLLLPLLHEANLMLEAGSKGDGGAFLRVRKQLRSLVGRSDADLLLRTTDSATSNLASLGVLQGLAALAQGDIDRATFLRDFGHQSPNPFELSEPRPAEDPSWVDRELAAYRRAPADVSTLLEVQQRAQAAAWDRLLLRHPRRATRTRRVLERARERTQEREAARSEQTRVVGEIRRFLLRAGELTTIGPDVFFLSIDEVLEVLAGRTGVLGAVPRRREAYERYRALPPYPALIRGAFDPFGWAADPDRRVDLYDSGRVRPAMNGQLRGLAGSAGTARGRARVALTLEAAAALQPGEVLVTPVTNVGWTPLFPRAAAIVTDVGAPLSHAAIVARELGIPAVVGCGDATTRLHTGDLILVDGTNGTVEPVREDEAAPRRNLGGPERPVLSPPRP